MARLETIRKVGRPRRWQGRCGRKAVGLAARAALEALQDGAADEMGWNDAVGELADAGRRAVRAVERARVATAAGAPPGDRERLAREAFEAALEMAATALVALARLPAEP